MATIGERLPGGRWTAVLAPSTALAVLVAVLGMRGSPVALPLGLTSASGTALVVSLVVAARSLRRGADDRFRLMLALAAVLFTAGQLLELALHDGARDGYASTEQLVSALALPFLLAGLLMLPRRVVEPAGSLRLLFEGLMIGSSLHLVLWLRLVDEAAANGDLDAYAAMLGVQTTMLGMLVVVAVRDFEPLQVVAAAGVSGFLVADLLAGVGHGLPPWVLAVVSLLTWPAALVVLVTAKPHRTQVSAARSPRAELRRTAVTAIGVLVPTAWALLEVAGGAEVDLITVAAAVGIISGFGGREVVRAFQARTLMDRLAKQANEDPLTGLGNRRALTVHLAALEAGSAPAAVLTLDIDRFKEVNSELGHAVGDALLVTVSCAITQACADSGAVPYRLGGDEFAVLLHGGARDAEVLAEELRDAVRTGAGAVPGCAHLHLTGSVGVAVLDDDRRGNDPLRSLTRSAEALRVAKESRDQVCLYDGALAEGLRRRATMERRLRDAVADGSIESHYQPVIDLHTGQVRGLEALSRWTDDELGRVPPDVFIALAEQTGLVVELGRQVLDRAVALAVDIDAEGRGVDVAVNVSPVQLRAPGFVDEVAAILHRHGADPRLLVIEVTEGIFMDLDDPAVQTLRLLSDVGVTIAIDDFGSGYSSFGYMSRLPADVIKVDRSLITGLQDQHHQAVLRAIVDMAAALGLVVVVEGVETPEVADVLRALGAGLCQGWLYSAAVPTSELPALLARFGTAGAVAAGAVPAVAVAAVADAEVRALS